MNRWTLLFAGLLFFPLPSFALMGPGGTDPNTYRAAFSDVSGTHPYIPAITWAKYNNVLSGYPDGTFQPDRFVNRVEFIKIVLEAAGIDAGSVSDPADFPDTDENAWYASYVRYAKKHGIIQGYPDGKFRPEKGVNFAEALKIAYLVFGIGTPKGGVNWYDPYLSHAKTNNFLFNKGIGVAEGVPRKDVVWIVWKMKTHLDN